MSTTYPADLDEQIRTVLKPVLETLEGDPEARGKTRALLLGVRAGLAERLDRPDLEVGSIRLFSDYFERGTFFAKKIKLTE